MAMTEEITVMEAVALEEDVILAIQEADLEVEVVQMKLFSPKSVIIARSEITPSLHVGN